MNREVTIGNRKVGDGHPAYIIAEIGINHNGSLDFARQMILAAQQAGVDAVKFQKRTPELCVPEHQRNQMRETPWGYITYLDYRYKVEFGQEDYQEIDRYCKELGIAWLASSWDIPSVEFMEQFNPPAHKIPSALLTDHALLRAYRATGRPLILSTGMSTLEEIKESVALLGEENLILCHTTSSYPCPPDELNLRMVQTLRGMFNCPVGYSGHEVGLVPSAVAVALGACLVERHITLDRAMWGSDQSASVEPQGIERLVKYIRVTEQALGDGVKQVYDSEKSSLSKLRRFSQ
ncbi:MAG TPA: N-acetylneuraminate synthase family protein [Anaerolineaceae bacterium]|jgi:N-acetylneuraminate synthase|nr:N-acetylneuraminate synthase family protein [Anaerolineales bacterium]HOG58525.1 N-acetylneuraminate synthase family protein [Anaerolineaceae bacterium]HOR83996.1 N-acetylneuraminate synthase family protein [Anaerolineaceae bacterium]HOT52744.1 N-acetylneuraminate synthase family protein [Anaerolineaceae bacterium]HPL42332.1 N-acetylneuraminate synthase family protein [Anaerolineaceae bacterium]